MIKNKILLIDDEESFCYFTKKNLEETGEFEVATAISADKGIKMIRKYKPDLILLDIVMPGKDGFEVLETIKKNEKTRSIPVIMLTAKGENSYKRKAARLYDEDYITKPVEVAELKSRMEKVISRRRGIFN